MRLPVLMILLCYVLLIVTDLLIIRDLRVMSLYDKYQPDRKKRERWWKVYGIFAILVLIVLTVAICLPRRTAGVGIGATIWLLYIVLTVEVAQIVYSIFSLIGFIPVLFGRWRWNTGLWVGLPLAVLFFSMMWWGVLIGRKCIEVVDVEVSSPALPEGFDGYRIAQISDLHLGTWGEDTTFVSRLVDSVNNLKPDLIVVTGDAVNREAEEFLPFRKTLSRLSAPDGVYTILGNHDYGDYLSWRKEKDKIANLDSLKSYQKSAGWTLLDNAHMALRKENGDSIILIGVGNWGEPPFSQYGSLRKAYPADSLKDDNYKILLSHNPEHWKREVLEISNIDLTLAGHTHAMQIMFKLGGWRWSPSEYRYDQWAGLYSREKEGRKSYVYVNVGAGEVGIPMRIGANPEITLITLKRGE